MRTLFLFFLFVFASFGVMAQGERQVIRFSGLVVEGDSSYGVPGVHLYVLKAGRGISTDVTGYFSMPTLAGDTVIVSAIGYKKQRIVIPNRKEAGYSVLIDLKADTTYLPIVEVFPFPSIEVFKEVFLATKVPETFEEQNVRRNLSNQELARLSFAAPATPNMGYRNTMNTYINSIMNKNAATTIPLLNPFAWAELIKSIKRGDYRKKNK